MIIFDNKILYTFLNYHTKFSTKKSLQQEKSFRKRTEEKNQLSHLRKDVK